MSANSKKKEKIKRRTKQEKENCLNIGMEILEKNIYMIKKTSFLDSYNSEIKKRNILRHELNQRTLKSDFNELNIICKKRKREIIQEDHNIEEIKPYHITKRLQNSQINITSIYISVLSKEYLIYDDSVDEAMNNTLYKENYLKIKKYISEKENDKVKSKIQKTRVKIYIVLKKHKDGKKIVNFYNTYARTMILYSDIKKFCAEIVVTYDNFDFLIKSLKYIIFET